LFCFGAWTLACLLLHHSLARLAPGCLSPPVHSVVVWGFVPELLHRVDVPAGCRQIEPPFDGEYLSALEPSQAFFYRTYCQWLVAKKVRTVAVDVSSPIFRWVPRSSRLGP